MLSVKREFTVEGCKYDDFKGIFGEFSDGMSVTVVDSYILASLCVHYFSRWCEHRCNR
jgi:hypothetical protein